MFILPTPDGCKSFKPVAPPPPMGGGDYDPTAWVESERARIAEAIEETSNYVALMEERLAAEQQEIADLDARRAQVDINIAAITEALDTAIADLDYIRQWSDHVESVGAEHGM